MGYRALPPITESAEVLRQLLHATRQHDRRERLQLLLLIKEGHITSRQQAASDLLRHRNTISRWIGDYEQGGLERLLNGKQMGRPPGQSTLAEPIVEALRKRLDTDAGFSSYTEVQRWLFDEYHLEIPYRTVHHIVRYSLKAKLKRARPLHPKKT